MDAKRALQAISYDLPEDLEAVVGFMHSSEVVAGPDGPDRAHPDRWRYRFVGSTKEPFDSFENLQKLPVLERQERLEDVFERHILTLIDELGAVEESLITQLIDGGYPLLATGETSD